VAETTSVDEKMQGTPATPPDDAADVMSNPKVIEALARIIPQEHAKLFGAELAERIERARQTVDRTAAALAVAGGVGVTPDATMSHEQSAEWLRVTLQRMSGNYAVRPDAKLDEGGLVTQSLTPTTASAGAAMLPDEFVGEVEKQADEPAVIWPLLTKRATKSRTVKKPEITAYVTINKGPDAEVNSATTATEIVETVPTFDSLEWNLEDFDARMPVKLDLLEESPIDVYNELIALCADSFSIEHEREPLIGTGHTNERPLGLLAAAAGITTVAVSAAPTVGKVLDFASQIPLRYRRKAKIAMGSDTLYAVIATLAENVRAAQFLVGKLPEMIESEWVTEGKMLGGDFGRYVVYHIRLLQIISSIAAERKTREIVVTECWTGQPTITDAFRIGTDVSYD